MFELPSHTPHALSVAADAWADARGLLKRASTFVNRDAGIISVKLGETFRLMGSAWAVILIGGIMVSLGLVHALSMYVPDIPHWAWLGIVGGLLLVLGAVLASRGRRKLTSLEPLREQLGAATDEAVHIAAKIDDAVDETRESLRSDVESVKSTMESIKNAGDLNYQVQQRPWAMFLGATGLGLVGGVLLNTLDSDARPSLPSENALHAKADAGKHAAPGVFAKLSEALAPQADLARQVAIGALFSLARDFAHERVSSQMEQPLNQFFDDAMKKFGGRPMSPGALKSWYQSNPPVDSTPPPQPANE